MKFYSTNKQSSPTSLQEAVTKGLASDKGLYMPEKIDLLPDSFFENIPEMTFREMAFAVASAFFGEDIESAVLKTIVDDTLTFETP
jgi:threonine synthase